MRHKLSPREQRILDFMLGAPNVDIGITEMYKAMRPDGEEEISLTVMQRHLNSALRRIRAKRDDVTIQPGLLLKRTYRLTFRRG